MIPCENCGQPFDPVPHRWTSPCCHLKHNCCEGAPAPLFDAADYTSPPVVVGPDAVIVPDGVPLSIHIGEDEISVCVGDGEDDDAHVDEDRNLDGWGSAANPCDGDV